MPMTLEPRNPRHPREDSPGDGWIRFARVGRPHGLKGAFFLKTDDNRTEWDGYRELRLEVAGGFAPCRVIRFYVSGGALAVHLDLLADRTAVEAFYEARLFVHRDEIAVGDDEEIVGDLVGLSVVDEAGRPLGTVAGVVAFGAQDNLRIVVPGRTEEVLFPFVDGFVLAVDKAAGTVRVRYEPVFFEVASASGPGATPVPGDGEGDA